MPEGSLFSLNMEARTQNGIRSSGLRDGENQHAGEPEPLLSLDQIRITGNCNEYTEGPAVVPRGGAKVLEEAKAGSTEERFLVISGNEPCVVARATSTVSTDSGSSTSSGQRLLAETLVESQPKLLEAKQREPTVGAEPIPHSHLCRDCGRCKCQECGRPRPLPFCWACGRRCVCSAQSLLDYATCVCCAKCLFYHCSNDDEDVCADRPCSCSQTHCCARWTALGVMSLFLPCLLCYLPAEGCLKVCQLCYDRLTRPGCRCKRCKIIQCKTVADSPPTQAP